MRRSTLALLVLALACLSLIVWRVVVPPRTADAPAGPAAFTEDRAAPATSAADTVRHERGPDRSAVTPGADAAPPGDSEVATLEVLVRSRDTGEPVPRATVDVEPRPSPRMLAHTDAEGRATLAAPTGVALRVWAGSVDGLCGEAEFELEPLAAGAAREVLLEVATEADLHFFARIVADESGEPLTAVHVDLREDGFDTEPVITLPLPPERWRLETTSDATGLALLRGPSWYPLLASFRADGRAQRYAELGPGHETVERALEVRLPRAASLLVRVSEAGRGTVADATVEVGVWAMELLEWDELPDLELDGGLLPELLWRERTDSAGATRLDGLPPRAPLELELHRGGELVHRTAEPIVLAPGEERELEITLGAGARIRGRAVDPDGEPVAELELWRKKAGATERKYFGRDERVVDRTTTDADGRFTFEEVAAGTWWVGPAARRQHGDPATEELAAPFPTRVEVPAGAAEVLVELVVHRGLYVRGLALDPEGAPVHRVTIFPTDFELLQAMTTFTGEDGRFALGPLAPGPIGFTAVGNIAGFANEGPITARPGEELVLHMKPAGILRGRVLGPGGAGRRAELNLERVDLEATPFDTGWSQSMRDGSFELKGISPGRCTLFARAPGGEVGLLSGLELSPGAVVEGLVVALGPGGELELSLAGEREQAEALLLERGSALRRLRVWKSAPRTQTLPPGEYSVQLLDEAGAPIDERRVELAAGEKRAVTLAPPQDH